MWELPGGKTLSGWLDLIGVLLLATLGVLFAVDNQIDVVVRLPGGHNQVRAPLFVVAFVPLFLGFLFGAVSGWARSLKYRKRADALRCQIRELEEELTNLRNLPLENDLQL